MISHPAGGLALRKVVRDLGRYGTPAAIAVIGLVTPSQALLGQQAQRTCEPKPRCVAEALNDSALYALLHKRDLRAALGGFTAAAEVDPSLTKAHINAALAARILKEWSTARAHLEM